MSRKVMLVWMFFVNLLPWTAATASEGEKAEWTVMVYMNGDNNLEEFAIYDFLEMAAVGSTEKVNIVVQLDRQTEKLYEGIRGWTDTLRFHIQKGMKPRFCSALEKPARMAKELDMGDPEVFRDFVEWAIGEFPANKYALVIWDHGDGFRRVDPQEDTPEEPGERRRVYRSLDDAAHRAVSHDETSGSVLFNRDIQDTLTELLDGKPLDVLGFDACLMGMVEVGYAMRDVAKVLVASEDLVPGNGWQYDDWLSSLVADPEGYDAEKLGKLLVQSYQKTYAGSPENGREDPGSRSEGSRSLRVEETTHSAVSLASIPGLADAIHNLAIIMMAKLDTEIEAIRKARGACAAYAPCEKTKSGQPRYLNIDLGRFVEQLAKESANPEVVAAARRVSDSLASSLLANYAGTKRQGAWGSRGLAIYFPADGTAYERDLSRKDAYKRDNRLAPVEFVDRKNSEGKEEPGWSDFLHAYFAKLRALGLSGTSAETGLTCP